LGSSEIAIGKNLLAVGQKAALSGPPEPPIGFGPTPSHFRWPDGWLVSSFWFWAQARFGPPLASSWEALGQWAAALALYLSSITYHKHRYCTRSAYRRAGPQGSGNGESAPPVVESWQTEQRAWCRALAAAAPKSARAMQGRKSSRPEPPTMGSRELTEIF
jgi:hypothetical protein